MKRRAVFGSLLAAPGAVSAIAPGADAPDYASAAEVFAAVDRGEAEVSLRLRALAEVVPGAKAFVTSVLGDHERLRRGRERLRRRSGLPLEERARVEPADLTSLPALRSAQEALVFAHAEGLPALPDSHAVSVMAGHLAELSRHLVVIDLWLEAEEGRRG